MKWEPIAAMVALLLLGVWIVYQPSVRHDLRADAQTSRFVIGGLKGELESAPSSAAGGAMTYRFLYRDGSASPEISAERLREVLGADGFGEATRVQGNAVFRLLNVTTWAALIWVMVGFGGQMAFFGRMAIQWVISEKRRQSVVPASFWWLSLVGGVLLFVYFAWRQDLVGILGQTSGIVIYARNLRLIHKQRRRAGREGAESAEGSAGSSGPGAG